MNTGEHCTWISRYEDGEEGKKFFTLFVMYLIFGKKSIFFVNGKGHYKLVAIKINI